MKLTICGVRVATWGAQAGAHFSLKHTIDQQLFGGNTGHAAISLTIPATPENEALIKKYCTHPPIPVEKQVVRVPQAKQDENGKWVPDHTKPAFEEEVYVVTFSWWPGAGGFYLNPSINSDGYAEREGVHREWDPKFRDFIEVEQRIHAGRLSRTKMTYGELNIVHSRNLEMTSEQRKYLNLKAQAEMIENLIGSLKVTKDKIRGKQKQFAELDARVGNNLRKKEHLKLMKNDIALLMKVRDILEYNKDLTFSQTEKERLDVLYPKWEPLNEKNKQIPDKEKIKAEINKKIDGIRQSAKRIQNDSASKIKKDQSKLTSPSETEIILFDRFLPNWRNDFGFDKNKKLTTENYDEILKQISEIKKQKKDELRKIKKEIKNLDYVNYPTAAREAHTQAKEIKEQIVLLQKERNKTNELLKEALEIKEIDDLHDFFYDTYLDSDAKEYLKEDEDTVEIKDIFEQKLERFTQLTGIDWKKIINVEKDANVPKASKEQIENLDDILFNYARKVIAVAYLNRYLDPKDPLFLKEGEAVKIDPDGELYNILKRSKRYCGREWGSYLADEDKSKITREEIQNLLAATYAYSVEIEKAGKVHISVSDPEKKEVIRAHYLKRYELESQVSNLKIQKAAFKKTEEYKKHMEFKKLKSEHGSIIVPYKLINMKLRKTSPLEKVTLSASLADKLTGAYKAIKGSKWDWVEHFIGTPVMDPLSISVEKLKEMRDELEKEAISRREKMIELLPSRDCFTAQDYESFMTMGLPPETEYHLTLDKQTDPENGTEWGMNSEAMLKEMHQIFVDDIPFDLNVNNCTVTASRILEAGAKGENLKSKFRNRVLGVIGTPQLIANNTEDYMQSSLTSPQDNLFKRIGRWAPLQKALGRQIHTILSKDSNRGAKAGAWVKAVGITLLSSPLLLLKGLLTPGNTVKQSINLMKFAQSKNHAGFKVASYILGGLGVAVFAVPAAIEAYIKAPFKIIKAIAQSVKSRNIIKNKQAFDLSQEQIKERAEKEKNLKQQVREIDSVIFTIKIKDPVAALEKALKLIKQGKIPIFDPKTRQSIEHQIANTKNKELREKRMKQFEEVVNYSIERVKSASKPVPKEKVFEDSSAKEERKDKRKSFIRQHGDKRDEAEVSKENQVAAVAEEDLADKRRPGVEAKK